MTQLFVQLGIEAGPSARGQSYTPSYAAYGLMQLCSLKFKFKPELHIPCRNMASYLYRKKLHTGSIGEKPPLMI
jgi:hypothetical protein